MANNQPEGIHYLPITDERINKLFERTEVTERFEEIFENQLFLETWNNLRKSGTDFLSNLRKLYGVEIVSTFDQIFPFNVVYNTLRVLAVADSVNLAMELDISISEAILNYLTPENISKSFQNFIQTDLDQMEQMVSKISQSQPSHGSVVNSPFLQ